VHATLVADLTANGLPRPANISTQESFDVDELVVDNAGLPGH
jgi:hypothetical protein